MQSVRLRGESINWLNDSYLVLNKRAFSNYTESTLNSSEILLQSLGGSIVQGYSLIFMYCNTICQRNFIIFQVSHE